MLDQQGKRDLPAHASASSSQPSTSIRPAIADSEQSGEGLEASFSERLKLDAADITLTQVGPDPMLLATLTLRPRPEDTIIAVMGVTGTGKSSFVQLFTTEPVGIGSGSQSCKLR